MITRDDLLRFSKPTTFVIDRIEDDSSERTEVKIFHLTEAVSATGSIPTSEGHDMKALSTKVYVAQTDIDVALENISEKDGKLVYEGLMHLDVSKPGGRVDGNGDFVVTKPAKIWLTSTKFSRGGASLRTDRLTSLNSIINDMFKGGKAVEVGVEAAKPTVNATVKPAAEAVLEKEGKKVN